jgi:hypothetical protein
MQPYHEKSTAEIEHITSKPVPKALDPEPLKVLVLEIFEDISINVVLSNYALVFHCSCAKFVATASQKFLNLGYAPLRLKCKGNDEWGGRWKILWAGEGEKEPRIDRRLAFACLSKETRGRNVRRGRPYQRL